MAPKQQQLDLQFFQSITKEESDSNAEKAFATLNPKGPRGVFLKKCSKSAISSSRSPNEFFFTFLHF
jgi:hypothetical protein